MAGSISGNGLPVNRLVITLTDDELRGVLSSGWEHLDIIPGAPLMSVKRRIAGAALEWLRDPQEVDPDDL